MIRLVSYLKKHTVLIFLTGILLFVQVLCDLSLPNYMSRIVDAGIMQSGIEQAAPVAVSTRGMTLLQTFMTAEQKTLFDDAYGRTKTGDNGPEYADNIKKYPLLDDEDVYVLTDSDAETKQQISSVMGEVTWTFLNTMSALSDQHQKEGSATAAAGISKEDIEKVYVMQPILSELPSSMIDAARQKTQGHPDTILKQSGSAMTKALYQELGMDIAGIQRSYILKIGLAMLLITVAGGIAMILVSLFSARVAAGVAQELRGEVFDKVTSFSNDEFDRFSTASLITRTTNDVMQVQMFLMGARMIFQAPIMGLGGTVMALRKSPSMSWIIGLACIIILGIIVLVFRTAMPRFKRIQSLIDRLNLVARENLNGLMVIRAFRAEKFEKKRFDSANVDLTHTMKFVSRIMVVMMPLMTFIMNALTITIVWVGSHRVAQSFMQIGDMMAFIQYAMQIVLAFLMLAIMFIMVPRASVAFGRIVEVLDTKATITDPQDDQSMPLSDKQRGVVEFRQVSFRYRGADENVLHDITFSAVPGKTTAIIGPTGAGKTTLVNLIPRFYDVTQGQVMVGGVDVRNVFQLELRDQIGYVPQKGTLFSGTIASNLRYGRPDASKEELWQACETAQAAEFVLEKEEGLQAPISESGSNVSGGQKQRLSIARALVKQPPIYIFDDSFSALDFKTDAQLRRALRATTKERTVIVVAQRVSTIIDADQILVMNEGRIVGKGTHRELLKTCPEYYEIASSQMSKEELA